MVIVGLPYTFKGQLQMGEITGCSPYGASTLSGDNDREPSANELEGARFQGKYVAELARAMSLGREHARTASP